MSGVRLTVLGARGFIGSAVVAAAAADPRFAGVQAVRRAAPGAPAAPDAADVRDPDALARVVAAADVVVNAAHVIASGGDLSANELGPPAVARAAARAGARCLEVGTAAVYGRGPLRGGAEGSLEPSPSSALSAARAAGEEAALRAGATVLRPMLVVGPGDRWAVPGAATAAAADGRPPGASVSVIDVADLARLVLDLAVLDVVPPLVHAARPAPVALSDLLREAGFRPRPGDEAPAEVSRMLHTDRWVGADLAWELVGWEPDGPLVPEATRRWYAAAGHTASG